MSNLSQPNGSRYSDSAPPPLPQGELPTGGPGPKRNLGAIGGALVAIGLLFAKFKFLLIPVLKFFPLILKTGGTMFVSIFFYAQFYGWWFAIGFVLLIFIHECGHLVMARLFGLNAGWPVFIPFMGAVIALKDAPKNAWMEAWVGIGGPLLGTVGAVMCDLIFLATGEPIFRALAYTGFFLNLFNLAPISPLDGGRIATALSPWLWILGLAIIVALAVVHPNFILFLIVVMALPRLATLFRKRTDEERRFFELSANQRLTMAFFYFGLIGFLVIGMQFSHIPPPERGQAEISDIRQGIEDPSANSQNADIRFVALPE
jgi:Zn-dependent protease